MKQLRATLGRVARRMLGRTQVDVLDRLIADGSVVVGPGSYVRRPVDIQIWEPPGIERPHVVIGRYCSIARGVRFIVNGDHRLDWASTHPFREVRGMDGAGVDGHPAPTGRITIGSDVWIGDGATVLGGVTIADGAAVGAGAVVSKDVPSYAVVVGNPAVVVRRRFSDDAVERLCALRWWELDDSDVVTLVELLNDRLDIDELERAVNVRRASSTAQ